MIAAKPIPLRGEADHSREGHLRADGRFRRGSDQIAALDPVLSRFGWRGTNMAQAPDGNWTHSVVRFVYELKTRADAPSSSGR